MKVFSYVLGREIDVYKALFPLSSLEEIKEHWEDFMLSRTNEYNKNEQ